MKRQHYTHLGIRCISIEPQSNILGTSIVDETTTVSIPRGQKVDEYDFQSTQFLHNWNIEE